MAGDILALGTARQGPAEGAVGEVLPIGLGCVLAAAVGVTDKTGGRPLPLPGHHQRSDNQFAPHVIAHRSAISASQTVSGREAETSCFRRFGATGRSRRLSAVQDRKRRLVRAWMSWRRIRRSTRSRRADPAFCPQGGLHARRAVALVMLGMNTSDTIQELTVGRRSGAFGS